jgi:hypothetical protein
MIKLKKPKVQLKKKKTFSQFRLTLLTYSQNNQTIRKVKK